MSALIATVFVASGVIAVTSLACDLRRAWQRWPL